MCNIEEVKQTYKKHNMGPNKYCVLSTVWNHYLVSMLKSRFKIKNGSVQIETQDLEYTKSKDICDLAIADISRVMHYQYHWFYCCLESFNLFKCDGKTVSI